MIEKIKEIKSTVEHFLKNYQLARNSDKFLIMKIWEKQGLILSPEQQDIFMSKNLACAESIRRTRQKLQEGGKYPANDKIWLERHKKEDDMRQQIQSVKPKPEKAQESMFDNTPQKITKPNLKGV